MIELAINPELHALVPEPEKEEYDSIKNSIKNDGQQELIIVWKDPVSEKTFIVDGHTRYKICQELEIEPKIQYKTFESWLHVKKFAADVNLLRRHLSQPKKVELASKLFEIEKTLAEQRKQSTIPTKGQKGFQPMSVPNGINTGRAVDFIAEKTGMSPRTVARIKFVLDSDDEELIRNVKNGTTKPSHAERQIRKEKAVRNPIPLPEGKYRVILSDVPFAYDNELEGAPNYPTLGTEEIINLKDKNGKPITAVFADDCIIFFFSPIPKLEEALKILNAWGFKYKTAIVWSKEKDGKPQEGTGYYVRATCELLLIATKGKIGTPLPKNRPLGIIKEPRTKVHSQKPERIRSLITKMYPGEKPLELFGRTKVESWEVWGDQIDLPDAKNIQKEKKLDEF
ncbi:MAG: MT-A70 family methyltransferase [Nitrososphaeraceae archaeon]